MIRATSATHIIAHRGASADAPENTMPAFMLAREQGAHMIEFDVRPTADGAIVVFHDDTTERWNGQPQPMEQMTLAEVQRLDINGARVPTLAELFDWARTTDLTLNVELKTAGIEQAVVDLIRQFDLTDRVIVSSFLPAALQGMQQVAPEIPRGVLMGTQSYAPHVRLREAWPIPTLRAHAATAWHPAWQLPLLDQIVPRVQAAGFQVNVWTVDDPAIMQRYLQLNVAGIITNRPALLGEVIARWNSGSQP